LVLLIGWPYTIYRYLQALLSRQQANPFFISWALAGFIFAVLSRLKSPHYLILWLYPLYIFIAIELVRWARGKRLVLLPVFIVLFVVTSVFTWHIRIIETTGDPVRQAASFIKDVLPSDSVIATENYIGFLFPQPYRRIDLIDTSSELSGVDYLAIYQSSTYQVSDLSSAVQWVYRHCRPLATFQGFKDSIVICPVSPERTFP
jgi:hypothetical protein